MTIIRKAAVLLQAALLMFSLAGCGKELSPLEKLAGYYEVDIEKAVPVLYPELSGDDIDIEIADMKSSGYIYSIKVDKEGKGNVILEIDGAEKVNQTIVFDPDKGTALYNGNSLEYTYKNRTIEIDGLTFVKMSKKSEAQWPFGAFVQVEEADGIASFWVPDDWSDATDWRGDDITLEYVSPDGNYDLSVFSFGKDEIDSYDPEMFKDALSLLNALVSNTRNKYASSIEKDDTFETEVDGCSAVRNDMMFKDGTGYTSVVYQDDYDGYQVILFETYSKEATAHMDEFVQYVTGHYKAKK